MLHKAGRYSHTGWSCAGAGARFLPWGWGVALRTWRVFCGTMERNSWAPTGCKCRKCRSKFRYDTILKWWRHLRIRLFEISLVITRLQDTIMTSSPNLDRLFILFVCSCRKRGSTLFQCTARPTKTPRQVSNYFTDIYKVDSRGFSSAL